MDSENLDNWNNILDKWTLEYAKVVLDELEERLKLLSELKRRTLDEKTREVQDLQPLFDRGLWIFGPEYETIEFTSNEGMTTVIQKLFGSKTIKGSLNRPDFVITSDSTIRPYYYPKYDHFGSEIGVDRVVIVELKRPGIPISTEQKDQCWKYVKELYDKGLLRNYSIVTCFVLGSSIDPNESHERTEKNENVRIIPMDYNIFIERAKSRLHKLHDRVKNAPFLTDEAREEFNVFAQEDTPELQCNLEFQNN